MPPAKPPDGGADMPADLNLAVTSIECSPMAIPCNDMKMTKVSCKGVGSGYTGGATFVWHCIPIGCDFKAKEGAAPCTMVDTAGRCESTGFESEVEITCPGKMPEQCSLRVVKGDAVSDTQLASTRFGIRIDPACPPPPPPPPDMSTPDMPPTDGGPDATDMAQDVAADPPADVPADPPVDVPADPPVDAADGGVG